MAISIKGINTGVIRNANDFVALALKIAAQDDKESLFFLPALSLRDLLIALESRLQQNQQLNADARQDYEKARDTTSKQMLENAPALVEDELRQADMHRGVLAVALTNVSKDTLTLTFTLHGGQTCDLQIHQLQIELLAHAIIRAINNAGMRELALRISSLLDFLPLYDADCMDNNKLEYDAYTQPEWKHSLFTHYLSILYRFIDETGKEHCSGAVVKAREPAGSKAAEAISRRLLDFSPRLKKMAGKPCQVFIRTLTADQAQTLTQDQCLYSLHQLRVQSVETAKQHA
ncbi:YjeJ family protein [Citrobacter amalonaticus]|uniref:YjeJ family protein n=1 Tax=Citrobacter amalonaticus TaxID=35703 RepID=UPI00300CB82A